MAAERRAEVAWEGDLAHGKGMFNVGSGAMSDMAVTWASRTQRSEGRTSPEELLAAAHAACYAMALSHTLTQQGHPPARLDVTAVVTFEEADGGFKVGRSTLTVRGRVPGLDEAGFEAAARQGEQGCPISNALSNNVEIRVEATLESE